MEFVEPKKIETSPAPILGLTGYSSSGKTYTALFLAHKLIAVRDGEVLGACTEGGRMRDYGHPELYPELNPFVMSVIDAPYHPDKFTKAIQIANSKNAACLILDSFTDEWAGEGGVLDRHDVFLDQKAGKHDMKKRNSWNLLAWGHAKKPHKKLHLAMLRSKVPIILCFRARRKIKKVGARIEDMGVQPVLDDNMTYDIRYLLHMKAERDGISQGGYDILKSGLRHQQKVFPVGGKVDDDAAARFVFSLSNASEETKVQLNESISSPENAKKEDEIKPLKPLWVLDDEHTLQMLYLGEVDEHDTPLSRKEFTQGLCAHLSNEKDPLMQATLYSDNKVNFSNLTLHIKAHEMIYKTLLSEAIVTLIGIDPGAFEEMNKAKIHGEPTPIA